MSNDKPYVQRDLIDHADMSLMQLNRSYDRGSAIETTLPDEAEVSFKRVGSYQGEFALVVKFDECLWVETGYYGSCSGCDAYLNHPAEETERLLRDAYCFETVEALSEWESESETLNNSYGDLRGALHAALEELGVELQ